MKCVLNGGEVHASVRLKKKNEKRGKKSRLSGGQNNVKNWKISTMTNNAE